MKIFTTTEIMADNQQSRFEKSLGLLTTRFVSLLQKAKDGVLDLKVVSTRDLARAPKKLTCARLSDRERTRHTWVAGILKEVRGEGIARVRSASSPAPQMFPSVAAGPSAASRHGRRADGVTTS